MREKNGFTLIELLAVIVILGIVLSIGTVSVVKYVASSREKGQKLTDQNILASSVSYAEEFYTSNDWVTDVTNDTSNEYSCVSKEQLIDKGYLKKNTETEIKYIKLSRNIASKAIVKKEGVQASDNVCAQIVIQKPKFVKATTYTSVIVAEYQVSPEIEGKRTIDTGNSRCNTKASDNDDIIGTLENGENGSADSPYQTVYCKFNNLKDDTEYESMLKIKYNDKTNEISSEKKVVSTKLLKAPVIGVINENNYEKKKTATINYDDSDIYPSNRGQYYFKYSSDNNIQTYNELSICDIGNIPQNCNEKADGFYLSKDNWFKLYNNNIRLTLNETGKITAYITDGYNTKTAEKAVDKIDDTNYQCEVYQISGDNANATIGIKLTSGEVFGITKYNWDDGTWIENKATANPIAKRDITNNDTYGASIKTRTGEEIVCTTYQKTNFPTEKPAISLTLKKENGNNASSNTWYNTTIQATFNVKDATSVKYCEYVGTLSDGTINYSGCSSKVSVGVDATTTRTYSSNGIKKLYIVATNNNGTSTKSAIIKIDKTTPAVGITMVKKKSCSDSLDANSDISSLTGYTSNSWTNNCVFAKANVTKKGISSVTNSCTIDYSKDNGTYASQFPFASYRNFGTDGYYKVKCTATTEAGNFAETGIQIRIDKVPPTTYEVKVADSNNTGIFSNLKCDYLTNGNYYCTGYKHDDGALIYSKRCVDSLSGVVVGSLEYVNWNLQETTSSLKNTAADTKGTYKTYTAYQAIANSFKFTGAPNGQHVYYGRYCVDRAGNKSPYFIFNITTHTQS